jgi:hypothetical protein
MDEEIPYPPFGEVLEEISKGLVAAQEALDQAFLAAAEKGELPLATRYVIPRLELEYRTVFSVQKTEGTQQRKLVVLGPKKIKEEKIDVQAMSHIRVEILAVPPDPAKTG